MTRGGAALAAAAFFMTPVAELRAGSGVARVWAAASASPVPMEEEAHDALGRAALAQCGVGESGLGQVAREVLAVKLGGSRIPDPDAIAFAQRAAGEPHPWARAWTASAKGGASEALLPKLREWLTPGTPLRRCGVASGVGSDGTQVLVVVSVEALADLAPLPTRARVGQWMTVEAHLHVPARGANVLVLGPSGAPQALLTSLADSTVRARFAPERAGEFTVQVMADVAAGPRPVLEATVFADVEPLQAPSGEPAPGEEDAVSRSRDDAGALARMLAVARAGAGQLALARDGRLDQVALGHSLRMSRAQVLAHDVGDGNPDARLAAAGLDVRMAGENVAHAPTLAQAHRALWESPSHRLNMLRPEFQRVGIGVTHGQAGDVWVTEIFAGDGRHVPAQPAGGGTP
jgi:uncharacterized protein YkwD